LAEGRKEEKMSHKELHHWDVSASDAIKIQEELRKKVVLERDFGTIAVIAGADMAVNNQSKEGYGGVIAYTFPGLVEIERRAARGQLAFPYVPGLLAFREAPILLEALNELATKPDLVILDGQGIAHPRGLGIASHIGLLLDKPTIGCAKSVLVGSFEEPGPEVGDHSFLLHNGKAIGAVLRTRRGVKPIFISPGHRIDLTTSIEIVLKCLDGYRLPKPTREADHFVAEEKRKHKLGNSQPHHR
jgi:deoxyribonuclease V